MLALKRVFSKSEYIGARYFSSSNKTKIHDDILDNFERLESEPQRFKSLIETAFGAISDPGR